jgi:hypothetical protein
MIAPMTHYSLLVVNATKSSGFADSELMLFLECKTMSF